jgi:teichuronic acid biosynthesis glycosyltransferase TuaC
MISPSETEQLSESGPAALPGRPQALASALASKIKILSLCCVYPNPSEPSLGLFVRSRLQHLGELADVKVIAPLAAFDYSRWRAVRSIRRSVPKDRTDGNLEVLQPAWFYPPLGGWLNPLFLFSRLRRLAVHLRRDFPFHIIDAHFGYPDGIAAALLARCTRSPFSVTLRGNELMHARRKLRRAALGWALRRADAIIAVSESLRRFAISLGAEPEKVKTIPNGVESRIYFPRNRVQCRVKLGLPAGGRFVLSAGALIERKGHHRVMEALKSLAEEGCTACLLIAGGPGREGSFVKELHQLPAKLNVQRRVRFFGEVSPERMAELMSAADVLCLASSREGWPNVVHEAMACGTPVVASNVGGVPEMIPSDHFGFVVPPGDPVALAAALRSALENSWDRAAIAAWAHSRSWQQVGREVLWTLCQAVAAGRHAEEQQR